MKRTIIQILLAAVVFLYLSGCSQIRQTPVAETPPNLVPGDSPVPDPQMSARFHYLKSLLLQQQEQVEPAAAALETAIAIDPDSSYLQRDRIRLYLEQGQEEEAVALAEALAEKDPGDVENLLMLVRLKKNGAEDEQIQRLLLQILELDPKNKEVYLRLGRTYLENQWFAESVDLFTRMAAQLPDYYVAHFYLGEAHLLSGNLREAEQSFLKTIDLEPDLVEPRFRLVEIYRNPENPEDQPDSEKILSIFEQILDIEPENDRALLEVALLYHKTGQADKAAYLFTELGKEARNNNRLLMTAVDLFISQKRYEDAVIVFSGMREADPDNDSLNFFLGMAHEYNRSPDLAIQHYLKVSPVHPQYKKTLLTIGFLYREMGQIDNAVAFLEYHHQKRPKDIDIIAYLSAFYEKDGRLEKAMALLSKGLADAPENTALLFRLGAVQDKAGLKEACIATMKEVIRLDPDDASALNYLGYTYADMGIHLDEAEILIRRALDLKPDDGYIIDSMGWVYYRQGRYDEAVVYLERAAELTDFEFIIASHLADAYVKTGQLASAMDAYRRALENAGEEDADLVVEVTRKLHALEQLSDPSNSEKAPASDP